MPTPPFVVQDYSETFQLKQHQRVEGLREFWQSLPAELPEITLEIGCGHGHFLTAYAAVHPHEMCVGVDLISKRIGQARRKLARSGLANLAFLKAEASELVAAMPSSVRLRRVFLLFPDPWPKRRHHHRRVLSPAFLDAIALRLEAEGRLHFRTDHAEFFMDMRRLIEAHRAFSILADLPWPFEQETLFQLRMASYQDLIAKRVAESSP